MRFVREGRDPLRGVNYSYSNAVQATRPPETAPDFAAGSVVGFAAGPTVSAAGNGGARRATRRRA
ncbi:hypothetical protein, partial [Streptomyces sp. SID9913]|uniref:hypothetical protein n=1 Tax=Streptomyces sp. SID9913 TaxID=2706117 RepID=UPI0019443D7A